MRIIAGIAKGTKLKSPKGIAIRPTSDRVKESIFNIIQNDLYDRIVIDLFSGTGNLGIEALSRGSKKVYFVDHSKESIDIIKENLIRTKLSDHAEILHLDVNAAIKKLSAFNVKAEIIFMDPPYLKGLIEPTLEKIAQYSLLKEHGILLVEHDKNIIVREIIGNLVGFRRNNYGNTCVSFYKTEGGNLDENSDLSRQF